MASFRALMRRPGEHSDGCRYGSGYHLRHKEEKIGQLRSTKALKMSAVVSPTGDIVRRLSVLALTALVWPAALATLVAKSANLWWVFELTVHFKLQYLAIGLLCVVPAIWLRRWATVALCVMCIVVNAHPVAQYFGMGDKSTSPVPVSDQTHASIRVASLNVWFGNTDYDSVADWIKQNQPDVVALVETDAKWQEAMARQLPDWPHQQQEIVAGQTGKMLLSKLPFDEIESIGSGAIRSPLPVFTINFDGVPVRLTSVHTHWPIGKSNAASRNRSLSVIASAAISDGPPLIAAGDFNISPFSPPFQAMLDKGRLVRSSAGRGWLPTWPHFLPLAGIQIDHILVPDSVTVVGFAVHKGLGSDHHGIIADLRVPRP